jgi:hypothetical protein
MRHPTLIILLAILSCFSGGGAGHYGGSDADGRFLSYPAISSPLSFSSFAADNNSTAISPMLLGDAIFLPDIDPRRFGNISALSHPLLPLWSQYSFFLPFPKFCGWSFGSNESQTSSMKDLLDEDENSSFAVYDTQSVRQFALQDGYLEGVGAHDDQSRMGLNHFLDDEEPPGRPLL